MTIAVGDKLPSIELCQGTPEDKVDITSIFKTGVKGVIFAVPGAFTPGCSNTHLPGYVQKYDKLKEKGVDVIACISVNDPYVMEEWGKVHGTQGKIVMLADMAGEFTKAIGMDIDLTGILGNVRSKRYFMLVIDGVVKHISVEPDGLGLTCSLADHSLDEL